MSQYHPLLKIILKHGLFVRCDLFKTINLDYGVEQIIVWVPAKHLEWTTECNETGSLRGINNQKSWEEMNIVQKTYLFLLSFVNTEQWVRGKHHGKNRPSSQNNSSKCILNLCNTFQLSCGLFHIPLELHFEAVIIITLLIKKN